MWRGIFFLHSAKVGNLGGTKQGPIMLFSCSIYVSHKIQCPVHVSYHHMSGGSALHRWRQLRGRIPDEFSSVGISQQAWPDMRAYQEGRCRAGPKRHLWYDICRQACQPSVHLSLGFRDCCCRSWRGWVLKGKGPGKRLWLCKCSCVLTSTLGAA